MQVANGEVRYEDFKRDFIDAGKEAETEAMKIVDSMEGNDAARSSDDLNVQHMVEIEEVRIACMGCLCMHCMHGLPAFPWPYRTVELQRGGTMHGG